MNQIVLLIAATVIVGGAFVLTSQQRAIEQLQVTDAELESALARQRIEFEEKLGDIDKRAAQLEQDAAPRQGAVAPPPEMEGLYELVVKTDDEGTTVYHFAATVGVGELARRLDVGVATSGWWSVPRLYLDYDGDGQADMDMLRAQAKSLSSFLPGANWVASQVIDPKKSQDTYNRFLEGQEQATFTAFEDIAEQGSAWVEGIWKWLNETSEELSVWIAEALQDPDTDRDEEAEEQPPEAVE